MAQEKIRLWARDGGGLVHRLPGATSTPVMAWEKNSEGRSMPGDRQAVDPTGLPVWEIQALIYADTWGRAEAQVITVKMAAAIRPTAEAMIPGGEA